MISSQTGEIHFFDVGSNEAIKSASSLKGTEWNTVTGLFGWMLQGIWPGIDYSDVNTTDRSKNGMVLATGDDFGQVNLFRYPCVVENAACKQFFGHSSHVTKVKFTASDSYLISTGGNDKTVMVWKTDFGEGEGQDGVGQYDDEEEVKQENDYDDEVEEDDTFAESNLDKAKQQRQAAKNKRVKEEKRQISKALK